MDIYIFVLLFVFLFLGVPIAQTFFLLALIGFSFAEGIPPTILAQDILEKMDNFVYLSILFFIFLGNLMARGQMANRIVALSETLFGWLSGGTAIATIVACALFGAICGSGTATIIAIGGITVPSLVARGYKNYFSVGLVGTAGTLGMIVPPSVPMIIYAVIAGVSVEEMFAAGYLPALMIVISLGLYSFYTSRKEGIKKTAFPTLAKALKSIKEATFPLMLILIIFVGIYTGTFSATEAGAVAVIFALFVEIIIYRSLNFKEFREITFNTGIQTGIVMLIIGCAMTFADYLVMVQIPSRFADFFLTTVSSKWVFLLITNVMFLIIGFFFEIASAIIIFTPLLLPLIKEFDINAIHFGVIFIVNMCIGYITPPVGMSLYVCTGIFKGIQFDKLAISLVPVFLILIIDLILITYLPWLSLAIPGLIK